VEGDADQEIIFIGFLEGRAGGTAGEHGCRQNDWNYPGQGKMDFHNTSGGGWIFSGVFSSALGEFIGHLDSYAFAERINHQQKRADEEHRADNDANTNAVAVNSVRRAGEMS